MTGQKIHETINALGIISGKRAGPEQEISEVSRVRRIHAAEIAVEREALRKAGRVN